MDLVGAVVATPLRDPREVWRSWLVRQGTVHQVDLHKFDETWQRLDELDKIYSIIYVPLDRPERDMQFAKIERALGETFDPDWDNREGHIEEYEYGYEGRPRIYDDGRDLSWIYELSMVKQFYREK